jgi:hypothetical protein
MIWRICRKAARCKRLRQSMKIPADFRQVSCAASPETGEAQEIRAFCSGFKRKNESG